MDYYAVEPLAACPSWADWLDDRHLAVKCKSCQVVYTGKYLNPKAGIGGVPKVCKICKDRTRDEARKALPLDPVLVEAIKEHALENYNRDGWDLVVESFTDAEIWEEIAGSKTTKAAIRKMKSLVSLLSERRGGVS